LVLLLLGFSTSIDPMRTRDRTYDCRSGLMLVVVRLVTTVTTAETTLPLDESIMSILLQWLSSIDFYRVQHQKRRE
jgi:hypothetical protein